MQYASASSLPLIKSPTLRVPRMPTLPADLHPLPPSLAPYFAYPFAAEAYVLSSTSSSTSGGGAGTAAAAPVRAADLAERRKRLDAYLEERARRFESKRREELRRLAPGWAEGANGVLLPSRKAGPGETGVVAAAEVSAPAEKREDEDEGDLAHILASLDVGGMVGSAVAHAGAPPRPRQ